MMEESVDSYTDTTLSLPGGVLVEKMKTLEWMNCTESGKSNKWNALKSEKID